MHQDSHFFSVVGKDFSFKVDLTLDALLNFTGLVVDIFLLLSSTVLEAYLSQDLHILSLFSNYLHLGFPVFSCQSQSRIFKVSLSFFKLTLKMSTLLNHQLFIMFGLITFFFNL